VGVAGVSGGGGRGVLMVWWALSAAVPFWAGVVPMDRPRAGDGQGKATKTFPRYGRIHLDLTAVHSG